MTPIAHRIPMPRKAKAASPPAEPANDAPSSQAGQRVRIGAEDWRARLLLAVRKDKRTGERRQVILANAANVASILRFCPEWCGVIARDAFTDRIVTTRRPPWHEDDAPAAVTVGQWSDADTARTVNWLARTWHGELPPIEVSAKTVDAAVSVAADAVHVHPVRDYLRALQWDGEARAELLAPRYLGTEDTPYTRAVGRCFLVGAVARVMRPGCKVDLCPILEGPQGTFKSTFWRTLAGPHFSDSKVHFDSKEGYEALRGVWICELAELASMRRSDAESVKAFLSAAVDHYRPSYGRHAVAVPRQTVFVGTTNRGAYLHDETGNRRFAPLRTGRIDLEALSRDRDQLWAEAVHRFDAGEPWHLNAELATLAAVEAEGRYLAHPWEEKIAAFLHARSPTLPHFDGRPAVTTAQILEHLEVPEARQDKQAAMTVAACLERLGWADRVRRTSGVRAYFYLGPKP